MKKWIQKYGQVLGGMSGIASAIALFFNLKSLGIVFAICALFLVVSVERLKT